MKKMLHGFITLFAVILAVSAALLAAGCGETPAETTTYTVSYVGGEGATGSAPESKEYAEGETVTLESNPFLKDGFSFKGWSDGEKVYGENDSFQMPAHDVTLTATWEEDEPEPPVTYAVTYSLGACDDVAYAGESELPTETEKAENAVFALAAAPVWEGYTFLGWNDGSQTYEAGADYTMPAHAVTLTATWEKDEPEPPATFAVTYSLGACDDVAYAGESELPTEAEKAENAVFALAAAPVWEGYTFLGWNDGSQTYEAGAQYTMPAHAVTLTATWQKDEPEKYTLSYSGGEGATGNVPASSEHEEGESVQLATPPADLANGDLLFAGWLDGDTLYQAGSTFDMPSRDVTLTAKWIAPNALAGKSFYSLKDKTLYQFGSEETDGFYPVTKIHLEGYSYQTSADAVRYSYDGSYKIQVKGEDWTDALTLDTLDGVTKLTLEGSECYLFGAENTVSVTGDNAFTLGFKLDGSYDPNGMGLSLTFSSLTVNGAAAELTSSLSMYTYKLSVSYDVDDATLRATVDLATLTATVEVYRVVLTAEENSEEYRATFSDPYNDYFRTLERFEVKEGNDWKVIVSENKSGSSTPLGDGYHYAFTVSVTVETTKTTYKIYPYTAADGVPAHFTVAKSTEHVKVTKTITTSVGEVEYETTWEYDDPADAALTVFKKDGEQKWASRFYYGTNVAEKVRNNVYDVTYTYTVITGEQSDHYETEEREVTVRVTFLPGESGAEPTVTVKEVATREVTFGDDVSKAPGQTDGLTWENGDGVLRYQVTVVVDQDDQIVSVKELVLYRSYWTANTWHRTAAFTPDAELKPDQDGFYVFTQTVQASRTNGATQDVTWHIRLKITADESAPEGFKYELHLQNEVTFEIDGSVISALTVLVDENGVVTLPTAEEVAQYLPEGKTFEGWQLSEEAYEQESYTTGGYGNSYYPTANDVKFVASLSGEEIPVVNELAGKTYYDWTNMTAYVFNEEQADGYYTIDRYVYGSSWAFDNTTYCYSVSSSGYTIFQAGADRQQVAQFSAPSDLLETDIGDLRLSDSVMTFEVTENGEPVEFKVTVTVEPGSSSFMGNVSYKVTFTSKIVSYKGHTDATITTPYTHSNGIYIVRFIDNNTIYDAQINMSSLQSTLTEAGIVSYTQDQEYRAELRKLSGYAFYSYCRLYQKQEDGSYKVLHQTDEYTKNYSAGNYWIIEVTGTVSKVYYVTYVPEDGGTAAHITVEAKNRVQITSPEKHVARFEWDDEGMTITMLQYYAEGAYYVQTVYDSTSTYYPATVEKKSDYVFAITASGTVYTVTVTVGQDGTPESFTVVQSQAPVES